MFLVCGATGLLGGKIVERLQAREIGLRVLLRPSAAGAQPSGVDVITGDVRDLESLRAATSGVDTLITTVNAIGRMLAGEKGLSIGDVDHVGNANLITAAEQAGVERFVFVSAAGLTSLAIRFAPFMKAKWDTEQRLRASPMRSVLVRPDMFHEVWLTSAAKFDWPNGNLIIFGRGEAKARYVSVDDVAEAVVRLSLADNPPGVVEFGGPDPMTRNEAADAFERATGRKMRRRHVPRIALTLGARALRRAKPEMASLMGMAYSADLSDAPWSSEPLEALGIRPRPAATYIQEVAATAQRE